ncbi:MAG: HupE/UreJ family protein [Bacteroidales bacterium]|nr:HupE/UreJ family protein [Bacteroidales bacterium]
MSIFKLYLELGLSHITDLQGYDHILFLITLCAVYSFSQWRSILILITGFTLGHCTTLILATLKLINISGDIIEFLIPVTIFITAIANIIYRSENLSKRLQIFKYITAIFFGLIHGLGFSNYLKSLLGSESSIIKPLLAFNIGIEIGQIFVVAIILSFSVLALYLLKLKKQDWSFILSGSGLGISLILLIERFPF